jgi:hypothetical protein
MTTVFLSYSTKDHHFAELVTVKLAEAGISVWRDQGRLRAGTDWRQEIERAISSADAVIVAMSTNSADSAYVTFEWAYALGNGSDLVPIKLNDCNVHPRLQTIQHLDFSVPGSLPWETLVERIREIDKDVKEKSAISDVGPPIEPSQPDAVHVRAILAYLNQRGYQALSFERVRQRIDSSLSDIKLNELIANNPTLIRHARLKTGKPGVARVQP